jgi:hypothetical protein
MGRNGRKEQAYKSPASPERRRNWMPQTRECSNCPFAKERIDLPLKTGKVSPMVLEKGGCESAK